MNVSRARTHAAVIALALTLAGCGKSLQQHGSGTSPAALPPVTSAGAVGLTTKNTTRIGGKNPILDAAAVALTVDPGLTAGSRAQAVVLVNARNWPAALAASALASAPLHAPLLYSEANVLPAASANALAAVKPTGASQLGGTQVIQIGTSAAPRGYRTRSVTAADPAAIAAQIEPLLATIRGQATHSVIVVASDGPETLAMPAAGLAAQTGAPILFVDRAGVPPATSTLLSALKRPTIYAIGPTSAISETVLAGLRGLGTVKRVNGAGPASNAIAVAQFVDGSFGWGVQEPGHGLVFASVARPLDAPAAAPLSAIGDYGPLLLVEYPNRLSGELVSYLTDIQPGYTEEPQCRPVRGVYNHGWLIGNQGAISATAQVEIDSTLEISSRKACTAPPITP
ncbi:MAG TPA: cell wall-binding repeat-containing protein [Solirubrobacteraceae bacterium]|jgi:hypothetical protein